MILWHTPEAALSLGWRIAKQIWSNFEPISLLEISASKLNLQTVTDSTAAVFPSSRMPLTEKKPTN